MFFPEQLYQLSQRDQQVTWLDPVDLYAGTNAAATSVSAAYTVPAGHAFLFTHAFARATPGAAQNFSRIQLLTDRGSGVQPVRALTETNTAGAANAVGTIDWQGELILTPGNRVVATCTFNAGAVSNAAELAVGGVLVPVANIQRV